MFEHRDPSRSRFRTFEVEAKSFELFEGARLSPGVIIGREARTGEVIKADYGGHVATAYFNPMNNSYLVMIYLMNGAGEERLFLEPQLV